MSDVCVSVCVSHSVHIHSACWFSSLSDGTVDRMSLNLTIAASSQSASSTFCSLSLSAHIRLHRCTLTVKQDYTTYHKNMKQNVVLLKALCGFKLLSEAAQVALFWFHKAGCSLIDQRKLVNLRWDMHQLLKKVSPRTTILTMAYSCAQN